LHKVFELLKEESTGTTIVWTIEYDPSETATELSFPIVLLFNFHIGLRQYIRCKAARRGYQQREQWHVRGNLGVASTPDGTSDRKRE